MSKLKKTNKQLPAKDDSPRYRYCLEYGSAHNFMCVPEVPVMGMDFNPDYMIVCTRCGEPRYCQKVRPVGVKTNSQR